MVKQMWYQAKGTLTTGPPPKYLIPESKHSTICLYYTSVFRETGYSNVLNPSQVFNVTPSWRDDAAHWPSCRVLSPSWNRPQWYVQELKIKNHIKSVFYLLYHLIFIAIAFAVHHCSECHFSSINSRRIEPELTYVFRIIQIPSCTSYKGRTEESQWCPGLPPTWHSLSNLQSERQVRHSPTYE